MGQGAIRRDNRGMWGCGGVVMGHPGLSWGRKGGGGGCQGVSGGTEGHEMGCGAMRWDVGS